jgi:chorismate synthase
MIGVVLDGLCPGLPVDEDAIRAELDLRRPSGSISTARREEDKFILASGVFEGRTTGTPLAILIPNADAKSGDYVYGPARPSHADLTAHIKYEGYEDYRGGGHFSGRLTAPLAAAGAILRTALGAKRIRVGTHIARLGGIPDRPFGDFDKDITALTVSPFPVLDPDAGDAMRAAIEAAREDGDSVGGVLETAVTGLPAGLGEPWFDTVEGELAHALFSIPAVKGVEFGGGFSLADMRGSEANDPVSYDADGSLVFGSNHSGGINGGITNGAPVLFRTAVKPTPTIAKPQDTVNFLTGENTVIEGRGRHDPAIVHRARVAVDAMALLVAADLLTVRYGCGWFRQEDGR